jgi:hypothetical protein
MKQKNNMDRTGNAWFNSHRNAWETFCPIWPHEFSTLLIFFVHESFVNSPKHTVFKSMKNIEITWLQRTYWKHWLVWHIQWTFTLSNPSTVPIPRLSHTVLAPANLTFFKQELMNMIHLTSYIKFPKFLQLFKKT